MSTFQFTRSKLRAKLSPWVVPCVVAAMLCSCSTAGTLTVSSVTYQAVNTKNPQPPKNTPIPPSAKILATYAIDKSGKIGVIIKNLTNEILVIDQEKSFLINTTGESQPYYDPNVYSTTTTNYNFSTEGSSLSLGALANAFGIGGPLGSILSGIGLSQSATTGLATSNTITVSDQKRINIGPRGMVGLSKAFPVTGVGRGHIHPTSRAVDMSYKDSPLKFSICISYSLDDGETFNKMVTEFYVTSCIYEKVESYKYVNKALRNIMQAKPDLLSQPWYMVSFDNNIEDVTGDGFFVSDVSTKGKVFDNIIQGMMYDYQ